MNLLHSVRNSRSQSTMAHGGDSFAQLRLALIWIALTCLHFQTASGYTRLADPARRWPGGIVYYKLDNNLGNILPEAKRAMAHIEEHTCLRFVERTDQANFISMRRVTDMGCTAAIGYQGNGAQEVTIREGECDFFSYLVHQFIQNAGMAHEHQRPDRDDYIQVNTSNVDPEFVRYFDKYESGRVSSSEEYDVESLMQYGSSRFSNNDEPTILFLNGSVIKDLQDKTKLSPLDIVGINTYYECPDNSSAGHLTSSVLASIFTTFCALLLTYVNVK